MSGGLLSVEDIFGEVEREAKARYQSEVEAEAAEWAALSPEEAQAKRDAMAAAYDAKWGALEDAASDEDDDEPEDDDDDQDEDEDQ